MARPADSGLPTALPAMTAVQAAVALGTFALSVLAPQLGVGVQALGWLGSALFGVGALAALGSGALIRRWGDARLAALCMLLVALAMACLAADALGLGPARWSLWPAVLLLGLAFGPETPASASVLARVTPPARRPWVFSIRQTGNQIGAMAGSLLLPWLFLRHRAAPFMAVAAVALAVGVACLRVARALAGAHAAPAVPPDAAGRRSGLRDIAASPHLRMLTLAAAVFTAVQVCLNFFAVSHAVHHWHLPVPTAVAWVAWMQAGGLAGRLLWGRVALRPGVALRRLLGALGCTMGAAGLLLFLWPGVPGPGVLALLLGLLGLSASGWNGVLLAEVAGTAGPARAGAVTGAVLLFGYAALALAPLGFAALGARMGTGAAYSVLLALAGLLGAGLLARRP
ncbi:MFS transporter [Paracidovorax oryzae]|uniref:MFS transporter n=1 Tax=Paracidovorax oryzae TaxID=862720 RepID=UPI0004799BF2|nr:MFS transporter [Paracidovorax oryzae]